MKKIIVFYGMLILSMFSLHASSCKDCLLSSTVNTAYAYGPVFDYLACKKAELAGATLTNTSLRDDLQALADHCHHHMASVHALVREDSIAALRTGPNAPTFREIWQHLEEAVSATSRAFASNKVWQALDELEYFSRNFIEQRMCDDMMKPVIECAALRMKEFVLRMDIIFPCTFPDKAQVKGDVLIERTLSLYESKGKSHLGEPFVPWWGNRRFWIGLGAVALTGVVAWVLWKQKQAYDKAYDDAHVFSNVVDNQKRMLDATTDPSWWKKTFAQVLPLYVSGDNRQEGIGEMVKLIEEGLRDNTRLHENFLQECAYSAVTEKLKQCKARAAGEIYDRGLRLERARELYDHHRQPCVPSSKHAMHTVLSALRGWRDDKASSAPHMVGSACVQGLCDYIESSTGKPDEVATRLQSGLRVLWGRGSTSKKIQELILPKKQ